MARNKTRLAKLKTAARRHEQSVHQVEGMPQIEATSVTVPAHALTSVSPKISAQTLFGYPVSLIYRDLFKTVAVVTVLIAAVIGWAIFK